MNKNDLVAPSDKDEVVSVQLHERDLHALVELLNTSQDLFMKLAENANKLEDTKAVTVYTARAALSAAFSGRLNQFVDFAEPKSKELH